MRKDAMPTIEFNNVYYDYVVADGVYRALEGVDLEVNDGEFVCLVGHSGCGKSTMLNLIAGLAQPTAGEVLIDGERVGDGHRSFHRLSKLLAVSLANRPRQRFVRLASHSS